jgi:hypothetical protein
MGADAHDLLTDEYLAGETVEMAPYQVRWLKV